MKSTSSADLAISFPVEIQSRPVALIFEPAESIEWSDSEFSRKGKGADTADEALNAASNS